MNTEDRFVLAFALRWLPYGGEPEEEILINFGMAPERYREYLRAVVIRHRTQIHPSTAAQLLRQPGGASTPYG